MKKRSILGLVGLPLLVAMIGCGPGMPDTVPVTGTVTLDGQPIEGASVSFLSEAGTTSTGKTDASGKFTLKTFVGSQSVDGCPPGSHQVGITKTISEGGPSSTQDAIERTKTMANSAMNTSDVKVEYVVPAKYSTPTMSGLTADVVAGKDNTFTFELSSN